MPQNDIWKSSKIRFLHCKIFKTSETGTGMGPPIFWKKKYQKVVFTYIGRLWIGFYLISNTFLKWQLKSLKWKVLRNVCYPTIIIFCDEQTEEWTFGLYGRTDCTFHLRISWVWPNYVTKKSSWSRTGSRIQILIRIGRVELNPDPVGFLLIRAKTIQQLKGKQWATHNRKN